MRAVGQYCANFRWLLPLGLLRSSMVTACATHSNTILQEYSRNHTEGLCIQPCSKYTK